MPYKSERIPLSQEQDRRRKLTDSQKDLIRQEYKTGHHSLNSLARKYNVSKKTILLIVNPESKAKNDERIKNHWRDYYNTEEHNKAMRDTRKYKYSLYTKGELKESNRVMGITTNTLNESLGLIDPLKQFRINEALKRAQTEQEKKEIEKEIDEVDAKIDYADDHGMSKDHLIDEIDALNEEMESYIYLFPELTYEDKEQLRNYNLSIVGRNRFEDEVNTAVKGSKEDLERYAAEYLDYQLHPDYLYIENDFAGEIESDMFEDFDINGDVDFSIETPNKLTIDEIKEIAMEHYEDGGDVVIETMTDEDIQNWIESDGTLDGLMNMFRDNLSIYQDRKAREYDDYHYEPAIEVSETEEDTVEPGEIIDDPMLPDEFEYDDDISDFGPGNPWDAPGMSVKDFLR